MKCLLIAIYELKAEEVVIIGHYGCGMAKHNTEDLSHTMKNCGIIKQT